MNIEEKKRLHDATMDLLMHLEALEKIAIRGNAESEMSKPHNDLTVKTVKNLLAFLPLLALLALLNKESNL